MPPRRKASAADGDAVPTRSSTRIRDAVARAASVDVVDDASQVTAASSKTKAGPKTKAKAAPRTKAAPKAKAKAAPKAKAAAKTKAPAAKANAKGKKRARDDEEVDELDDDQGDEEEPAAKKTKADADALDAVDEEEEEEEEDEEEPPKKMVRMIFLYTISWNLNLLDHRSPSLNAVPSPSTQSVAWSVRVLSYSPLAHTSYTVSTFVSLDLAAGRFARGVFRKRHCVRRDAQPDGRREERE